MRPKRLISLLVAVCMMITMLPLSAVTAFAYSFGSSWVDDPTADDGTYKYAYEENEDGDGDTVTITKFLGPVGSANPVDSANPDLYDIKIPATLGGHSVTGLGRCSFSRDYNEDYSLHCNIRSVTIPESVTFIGTGAFDNCHNLTTLSLGEKIETIGPGAFEDCPKLTEVTIPESVTSIGALAFAGTGLHTLTIKGPITMEERAFSACENLTSISLCDDIQTISFCGFQYNTSLETVTLPKNLTSIGGQAFLHCSKLKSITIPEKVTTIESDTFKDCSSLEYIMLPAGLTSFGDRLSGCPDKCVIYSNKDKVAAHDQFGDTLAGHKLLGLCHVTFDAKGGELNDSAKVPVYETEKITDTKANELTAIHDPTRAGYKFTGWYTDDNQLVDVNKTEIMEDITLHAGWEFDPNAPGYRPLTVTGGTVTVKYDGSDVTSKLNSNTDAATGQKTYSVPEGAEVTVTLDKTLIPEGNVFDSWSTGNLSLPTGQDCKAESITFPMSSGVNVSATYRDAATDHTPGTAVCHPLTVTGGIVTVKNGDKDVTDTLTVTTDETTGKKTYSVPDGATVTVTLDKTLIPEGMVFDIWSTGKFSLPLGQDYKAETITFTMNTMSSDADIAAQYRDATIEDDGPNVLGTAAIIGTAAVGGAVLGYQAYSLGTEFAGKLMALPYFPSNRSALAMMLWEDAGKPMPESELLYPDVGQEEQDMDLQHAARWAMENELIPDLNDEGTAPEEMKFFPANPVSKLDVLNAWQKAQELKNN